MNIIIGGAQIGNIYGISNYNLKKKINKIEFKKIFSFLKKNKIEYVDSALDYKNSLKIVCIINTIKRFLNNWFGISPSINSQIFEQKVCKNKSVNKDDTYRNNLVFKLIKFFIVNSFCILFFRKYKITFNFLYNFLYTIVISIVS